MKRRRIVQLVVVAGAPVGTPDMAYAVADDGTAWWCIPLFDETGTGKWHPLPELPAIETEEDRLRAQFPDGPPGTAAEEMSAEDEEDAAAFGEQLADERRARAQQERASDELAARRSPGGGR